MMSADSASVARFDRQPVAEATALLRPVCASQRWIAHLIEGRPYGTIDALMSASDVALSSLEWDDIHQALSAHPRIGDRPTGADRESAWSREEQSAAARTDAQDELRAANAEYEHRFGHVFLICATGRTTAQILGALRQRLEDDPATERSVVQSGLGDIVPLRLAKTFT